ncbi:MAG: DoxX family protein [Caldilineae bacterium]|nr:DoxX family protein [Caldilineae bacterium]
MAFLTPYRSQILGLTRIAIGLLYWSNGAKKLFGWFGGVGPDGGSVALASRMGAAGAIEFFGGLAIILGLYTSVVAFVIAGEMLFAYLLGHVMGPDGTQLFWWANGGERAAIYAWFFLLLSTLGGGAWSLDRRLGRGDG